MPTILVTDSLFIGDEEVERIESAGYAIERIDKPRPTEEELVNAIPGKVGYILGGIETVTAPIIDASDELRVISFTGSGYTEFIPAWEAATEKGIAITAATGENAPSVAEWSLATGLAMARNALALASDEGPSFHIAREFTAMTLGIVGLGNVGSSLAQKAMAMGLDVIATESSHPTPPGVQIVPLEELLQTADIVSIHVDKQRGHGVLSSKHIEMIKTGATVVNAAFDNAIDNDALVGRLGEIRGVVDYPLAAPDAPPGSLLASNAQTAFNTQEANKRISVRTTDALLAVLDTGEHSDLVNPGYRTS